MADPNAYRHPLVRSGTNQQQRFPQALSPSYVKVDERDYAELILFAKKYASFLHYYNFQNLKEGDWSAIIDRDVSAIIAGLAAQQADRFTSALSDLLQSLRTQGLATKARFKFLFDFVLSLAQIRTPRPRSSRNEISSDMSFPS